MDKTTSEQMFGTKAGVVAGVRTACAPALAASTGHLGLVPMEMIAPFQNPKIGGLAEPVCMHVRDS
jgi:uncharacterized membrane protein